MIYIQCKPPASKHYPNQFMAQLAESASLAQSLDWQVKDTLACDIVQTAVFPIITVKGLINKAFFV
jgi:hypothetical protein